MKQEKNMKKEVYEAPTMDVVVFEDDVLMSDTLSGIGDIPGGGFLI